MNGGLRPFHIAFHISVVQCNDLQLSLDWLKRMYLIKYIYIYFFFFPQSLFYQKVNFGIFWQKVFLKQSLSQSLFYQKKMDFGIFGKMYFWNKNLSTTILPKSEFWYFWKKIFFTQSLSEKNTSTLKFKGTHQFMNFTICEHTIQRNIWETNLVN